VIAKKEYRDRSQELGVNEPRRSEGHEGRRKKEEEEGSSMSSQIYLVIEE
jgi:hypothetical protein